MSDVLFVHRDFPPQFGSIAETLDRDVRKAARETRVNIWQPAWTTLAEPMLEAR